jgi:dTDP-4-dehydrorhamnose reductase
VGADARPRARRRPVGPGAGLTVRVFVTGARGQLARALGEAAAARGVVLGHGARPAMDLLRPDTILPVMTAFAPDVVVNAAAYTAVDQAEREADLAFAVNRDGAAAVAAAAARLGVPVIQLSTDYVFDGRKGAPYGEGDAPAPLNAYGRSKLAGEAAVAAANPRHTILRTTWVFAPYGGNFVRTVIRLAAEQERLRVVEDQLGCPTYAPDLAQAILAIAGRVSGDGWRDEHAGVYHAAGPEGLSRCAFARTIVEGLVARGGRAVPVEAITLSQTHDTARRPADTRLSSARLQAVFGPRLPPLRASLAVCLDRLAGEITHRHRSAP